MIYEQLSKRWSSAIQNKEKLFLTFAWAILIFWSAWYFFFLLKDPFSEIEFYRAQLFREGFIPYLHFEDYRWPGRYLFYTVATLFPGASFFILAHLLILGFYAFYFFKKFRESSWHLLMAGMFFTFLLLYKGVFTNLVWFVSPLLLLWWDKDFFPWPRLRLLLSILAFVLMPTLLLIYLFSPGLQLREKVSAVFGAILLNLGIFLYSFYFWEINWGNVWNDFTLFWFQNASWGKLTFSEAWENYLVPYVAIFFNPFYLFFLLLGGGIYFWNSKTETSSLSDLLKPFLSFRWTFLALLIYPALSHKFYSFDFFFLFLFLIFVSSHLLSGAFDKKVRWFFPLVGLWLICAIGAKYFPAYYYDKDYSEKSYQEVKEYLASVFRPGDHLFVYEGAELYPGSDGRYFLLHRDLKTYPQTFIWDKYSLFHHINDPYQIQRQYQYLYQIEQVRPRFIVVPPQGFGRPYGENTLRDFYRLMDLRTKEYKLLRSFDSLYGPINVYERL